MHGSTRTQRVLTHPVLAVALLVASAGCCAPARVDPIPDDEVIRTFEDARPASIPPEALHCMQMIRTVEKDRLGSAIAIAEDLLLTAEHVVEGIPLDDDGWLELLVSEHRVRMQLLARGERAGDSSNGDWALLRAPDHARFPELATIDPRTRDASWTPEDTAPLIVSGYASGFFRGKDRIRLETAPSLPAVFVRADHPEEWFSNVGPYDLGGMSGGGVFLRDDATGTLRLIAVHTGRTPSMVTTTTEGHFLGWSFCLFRSAEATIRHTACRLPPEVFAALEERGRAAAESMPATTDDAAVR